MKSIPPISNAVNLPQAKPPNLFRCLAKIPLGLLHDLVST
jgi:hypothetical protein